MHAWTKDWYTTRYILRQWWKWLVLALCGLVCSIQPATADPTKAADKIIREALEEGASPIRTRDLKYYGRATKTDQDFCYVASMVDLLTDEKRPQIHCRSREVRLSISNPHYQEGLILRLYAGRQPFPYDFRDPMKIVLRFSPGPVIERQGIGMGDAAEVHDQQFINSILVQLVDEGSLVAVVGAKNGVIDDLTGAAQAVQDFQQRMAAGQQTLDIPPVNASD